MKISSLLFLLVLTIQPIGAQDLFKITGKVIDQNTSQPLSYCSVALFKSSDSTLLNGVLTDEKGNYSFGNISEGQFYIAAQYIGYHTVSFDISVNDKNQKIVNIKPLSLTPTSKTLSEVNVKSNKRVVQNQLDKQVYQADKFLNSQGGTAIDVLRNTPSVTVNSEGEITMRGSSGFLVLLNGKPIQTDPNTVLNQIPANTIQNIEIITSPSARYDPDGKSGIINITTKTALADSRSFSANAQGGFPSFYQYPNLHHPKRFGADATMNVKTEKWDMSVSGNYLRNDIAGRRTGYASTTIDNVETTFPSDGERSFIRYNYTVRASATYTPNSNNSFSGGFYKGFRSQSRRADLIYNNTKTDLTTGEVVSRINYFNSNVAKKSTDITLGNLDYTHTFQNKSSMILSGLFENANLTGLTTNINTAFPDRSDVLQLTTNPSQNPLNAFRLKADYIINIGKGKLETGYQYRNQVQKGWFQYLQLDPETGEFVLDSLFSSNTKVVNHIHSLYGQFSGKFQKLEYIGGLRYEYSTRAFTAGATPLKNLNLSNLFPSVNVQYELTKSLRAKASYSKRVQRTTANELNPFPEREHSETLESGDPNILPEFIDLTELGLTHDFTKGTAFFTVYNQRIKNVINRVNSVYNDSILNRIYTNAGVAKSWGMEAATSLNINKIWQLYLGGNIYNYSIKGGLFNNLVSVNSSSLVYSMNANTTFRISPTFQIQGTFNYLSKRVTAQGEDSRFITPGMSAKKTFMNGKLAATFQWQNMDLGLFGTNRQRITTFGKDFYTTTNYIQETDIFILNLSYNINQLTKKTKLPASEFGEKEF